MADDDADIRALITFKLEQAGHEVTAVGDGLAAVRTAQELLPDVAIVDVTMPGMTGLEVCVTLRAEERTARIPVILLTARAQADDQRLGLESGAAAYMTKPFSPRELLQCVATVLDRPAPAT